MFMYACLYECWRAYACVCVLAWVAGRLCDARDARNVCGARGVMYAHIILWGGDELVPALHRERTCRAHMWQIATVAHTSHEFASRALGVEVRHFRTAGGVDPAVWAQIPNK